MVRLAVSRNIQGGVHHPPTYVVAEMAAGCLMSSIRDYRGKADLDQRAWWNSPSGEETIRMMACAPALEPSQSGGKSPDPAD